MDKAIISILLIAILAIVLATSLVYYVAVQSDQTQNNTFPTPTPSPEATPTQSPVATPTPVPNTGTNANLVCNVNRLGFITDGGLRLLIYADIVNTGAKTAYNVSLHIETWFSDGGKGVDEIVRLNDQVIWIMPFRQVDIDGGETYSLKSRFYSALVYSVPYQFWLDDMGTVFPYDLISSYDITPLWDDTS